MNTANAKHIVDGENILDTNIIMDRRGETPQSTEGKKVLKSYI
jgi:hypothetical protein